MVSGEKIKKAALLYGCFAALLFYPDLRPGNIFFTLAVHVSDVAVLYLPSKIFFSRNLQAGRFPDISRELAVGFPIHAEGQGGFLYPPNLPFALLGSWIYNGLTILHLVLAAMGMCLALNRFGFSYGVALWSGLLFGFGGFFIGHIQHLNLTQAASWLGILFLFASAARRPFYGLWAGFSGAVLALTLFSGFPQITYFMTLALFVYWVSSAGGWRRPAGLILLSCACAFLLASAQLLPQVILAKHSVRASGIPWNEIASWSYQPKDLLMFFFPYIFGNPLEKSYIRSDGLFWENIAFVGWLPLFFAAAALFQGWRRRWVRFWGAWVLFVFIFIMADTFPLGRWLFEFLPGMNLFRMPQRSILLAIFGILMLSAWGLLAAVKRRRALAFAVAFLISASELFIFATGYNYSVALAKLLTPPKTVRWLWNQKQEGGGNPRIATEDPEKIWLKTFFAVDPKSGDLEASLDYLTMLPPNYNLIFGVVQGDVESPLKWKGLEGPSPRFLLTTKLPGKTMPLAAFDIGTGLGKAFFLNIPPRLRKRASESPRQNQGTIVQGQVAVRLGALPPLEIVSSALGAGIFLSLLSLAFGVWFFVHEYPRN